MDIMELTFLGTASAYPTPTHGVSCIALRHDDGVWLFDCGEGSQIQLMKSSLKPGKINKIFITHLHGDHLFGLPGLLCTISQNNQREGPVEIYGPLGLRHYLCSSLYHSYSDICFHFVVYELQPLDIQIPENWPQTEELTVPLHPKESPGKIISADENQVWHLFSDPKLTVKAVYLKHRVPCFAFVINEAEKSGRLNVDKLKSLGVSPGPLYAKIKTGETIVTADGQTIHPSDVVGQSVPGRVIAVCGDSCDSGQLCKVAQGADVLVHETTLENSMVDQCIQNGHSTPAMTANLAKDLGVKQLIITHFSARYKPESCDVKADEKSTKILLQEVLEILPAKNVKLAEDLSVFNISR
ncbi:Zinc phosphodiesterase ELAC protein 1 [Bulinus truncatus]|nr:Zinc phosphodiesterase ELAC protein 1 [Bulinus truncatus]